MAEPTGKMTPWLGVNPTAVSTGFKVSTYVIYFLPCLFLMFLAYNPSVTSAGTTSSMLNIDPKVVMVIFILIWLVIYLILAYIMYLIEMETFGKDLKTLELARWLYVINLLLNVAWIWVYFKTNDKKMDGASGKKQKDTYAFIILLILLAETLIFAGYVHKSISKRISYFFIPYIIWLVIASFISLEGLRRDQAVEPPAPADQTA